MKKSLTVILSTAMALSMFSSVAFGKTSADFTDLKDLNAETKAKFDALISAGIFEGTSDTNFGLKEETNRAQFAKIAAKLLGLKTDATTSSFTDVKSDDPANGYALGAIEALSKAGLTDGVAPGKFDPAGKVTKEQLATFLIRALGKDAEGKAKPGVTDTTVSDWAKGYVALALELKLLSNGSDGKFGGTANATRDLLVLSSFEAKTVIDNSNVPANIGITEVKATNYNQLTVTFNGPVADGYKLAVKKGTSDAGVKETKLSTDKRSAVITLESRLTAAEYSVTLSGITNLDTAKQTAKVTAEDEKVSKVEFTNASDLVARGGTSRIEFRAVNQYGQAASYTAKDFTINLSSSTVSYKNVSGQAAIDVLVPSTLTYGEKFAVTVILQSSGISASKVFTANELQRVSKVELGDLKNETGEKVSYVKAGKSAYLNYSAYDQYGFKVTDITTLNTAGTGVTVISSNSTDVFFEKSGTVDAPFVTDVDNDGQPDLKINAKDKVQGKYTIQTFASGSVASKEIEVAALKVPATLEFADYTSTLADGDQGKFVTIKAKDSQGTELTAQDIADSASVIRVYGTGPITIAPDVTDKLLNGINLESGSDKGKIKIASVTGKGPGLVVAYLKDKPTVEAKLNVNTQDKRKVDVIKFSDDVPAAAVKDVTTSFKLKTFDQYNEEIKATTAGSKVLDYKVKVTVTGSAGITLSGYTSVSGNVYTYDIADIFDKSITIGNTTTIGSSDLKFEIINTADSNKVVNDYSRTIRVIDAVEKASDLNYTVSLDKVTDSTLFGIVKYVDSSSVTADTYKSTVAAKTIKLDVKDSAGKKIATSYKVIGATSSNSKVAQVVVDGSTYKVVGYDTGEATLQVQYETAKGTALATVAVKVKKDQPTVSTLKADKSANAIATTADIDTTTVWKLFNELTVNDNYGTEYKVIQADITGSTDLNTLSLVQFKELLNGSFYVSDIVYVDGATGANSNITVSNNGTLTKTAGKAIKRFKLNALYGGKTVSADVDVTTP